MSNFEQFLGGSEKLGEVIPMVSSEMPYIFSASGGTYLRSGYTTPNTGGLYNTYVGLTHTDTVILPYTGETSVSSFLPLLKSGTNYINNNSYTTDLTTAWTAATGGTPITLSGQFIVGTTVANVSGTSSAGTMVDYSTDDGETYTTVVGNNLACRGAVNSAGDLAMVVRAFSAGTASGDIYTTVDGVTWTARTPSVAMGNINSIHWSPVLSAFVINATTGSYKTTDGFTMTAMSIDVGAIAASSATSLVTGSGSTFSRTTDGVTFTSSGSFVSGQTLYTVSSLFYVNNTYYATGANSVVFKSTDDGLTWERLFISFDSNYILSTSVPYIGWVDGALYVNLGGASFKTNATLTVNGVMARVKAEPTEGYAYVRIQ